MKESILGNYAESINMDPHDFVQEVITNMAIVGLMHLNEHVNEEFTEVTFATGNNNYPDHDIEVTVRKVPK